MPLRREQRAELLDQSTAKRLALRGEAPLLLSVQEQTSAAKLLPDEAVLLLQVRDDFLLLPASPTGNGHNEGLPRCRGHGGG